MKRFHLFEFEDLPWFPSTIRNFGTDYLQYVANKFDFYKDMVPLLLKGVRKSRHKHIVDLASGGGGGWLKLSEHLHAEMPELTVKLTDYYPNRDAFEHLVAQKPDFFEFIPESVSALDVPSDLDGFRTQFLSFHHFKPKDAQQILQNAVDAQVPIAIFEAQVRDFAHLFKFAFSPIGILLLTPFIRPFKLSRIIFTYLIPIVPLFVFWDGLVSVLRTYSIEEMKAMTTRIRGGEDYTWEIRQHKSGSNTIQFAFGHPKNVK